MKKHLLFSILCLGMVLVFQGPVSAYTIDDNTLVGKGRTNDGLVHAYAWQDVIGLKYNIFGIDLDYSNGLLNVKLFSNFDGVDSAVGVPIGVADLFLDLDCDSVYEYGVVLSDYEKVRNNILPGQIYTNYADSVGTSYSYLEGQTGDQKYRYGELMNQSAPEKVPVHITAGTLNAATATLANPFRTDTGGTDPTYMRELTIPLSALGWTPDYMVGIFWAGSTCANDIIEGKVPVVPEPATMLLLGAGLVGLAAVGRRRLKG